ncbi:putative multidrug resistance ABC transporter ATP-binding/permease protein YheI [Peptoniphilus gorbachii]|uniref:Putative multidrug resistance ABC transporter ATP-binding/permease protein YheI n=1 Tax=Peptoniphilus gorbachii TaxID=411567 RepID=A0A6N3CCW0_9FIRM
MQIFSNVLLIKTSVGYQSSIKKWNEFYNRQISLEYNREKILGLYQSFMMSYRLLPTFIILLIGSFIINSGLMTTDEMMAFITLTNIFFNPLATIMQTIFDSQYTISIIDRLMEITLDDDEITDKGRNISEFEKLELKNVSFSYNNNYENMVVDNISFKLKKGQSLSIIGKTGCGKTTIVKLLLSIYSQYKGNILLNNINIKNYNLDTYRKIFGVVLQDQMFFNDTIRNNLDISNEHTDEEIYLALKIACFDEEVQKMPFNIHTQIGDNGSNLSGGQRQRLAIARALLTKPKIIILDEGTNQLDAITENKIMKKLRDENISLILITHRLSSIIFSDEILLLDNGRIVDRGTHKELKDRSDFYCSLIDKQ